MAVDIYHSRRVNYKKVLYYNRDENVSVGDMAIWVLQTTPKGIFYARDITASTFSKQQVNNTFMFDKNTTTIETSDDVSDLEVGSVLLYLGKVWFVENIQAITHTKSTEFSDKMEATYYIAIRR